MFNPVATYRVQFHKDFSFKEFEHVISYLKDLGVSTVYASPIFAAVPGSIHGYDGIDPHKINPEIGTEEELRKIYQQLKKEGINWLQDIVPNHMAFDPKNVWLMDVLEKGKRSQYATLFDILWDSKEHKGKLMVPFLGKLLDDTVKDGELKLDFQTDRFVVKYYDAIYPLNPRSYTEILTQKRNGKSVKELLTVLEQLNQTEDAAAYNEQWSFFKKQLSSFAANEKNKAIIENSINNINENKEQLLKIAEEQEYRLCHWQETDERINYRRFFTVNGLICLNIQDDEVFAFYHQYIKQLLDEGIFQGLRVDHIDGLYDPTKYLNQLRSLAGADAFITVEKILERGENLPTHWPIEGNTGYDFLSLVNNLFTKKENEQRFTQFYQQLTGDRKPIQQQLHEKKAHILFQHMNGELENLYQLFLTSDLVEKKALATIHPEDLKEAIAELLIQCPVYRYYPSSMPLEHDEAFALKDLLERLRKSGTCSLPVIRLLEEVLLEKTHEGNEAYNARALHFYKRCMQFSGPLMAKGVEDTLMYAYNRFIAHNEVGDAPESFGITIDEFHKKMQERLQHWPLSMNASATHDTKRGEDFRARLNVLSDLPDEWFAIVNEWCELNQNLKINNAPDANDEYLIYQSLVGSYPGIEEDERDFAERFQRYLEKALREAKQHSNWTKPNEEYEVATKQFANALLNQQSPFWKSFLAFHEKIIDHGIVNSLAQVILKFTCPGVPDIYQGCELWDFSFVDPDNRRAVDFAERKNLLNEIKNFSVEQLWQIRRGGEIKLWLTQQLLQLRKTLPDLFAEGDYIPLKISGVYKDHVIAFARKHRQHCYIVALPLHTAIIAEEQNKDVLEIDWQDTRIHLPTSIAEVQDLFCDDKIGNAKHLILNDLFKKLPFALLKAQQKLNERGAGVLMHITSLPSSFGIGDMGPSAKAFSDFLYRTKQKYWQLLPLNPTEAGQGHSPYSATSSKAGNILLISPELLAEEGLLDENESTQYHLPATDKIDYAEVECIKKELLQKAFDKFTQQNNSDLLSQLETFCSQEEDWLNDFALYSLLKKLNEGRPWYEWKQEWKQRDANALQQLKEEHRTELRKIKFAQFLFFRQWHRLKAYCNERNIRLIGDLPFYVSYDSVDVWSHKEIFAISESGERTQMAGVPPDAFSADGQLWGMPVFKWDILKESNYDWWVKRLRKNVELFDIIRLDHFRAFAAYWQVPADETTAKNGEWKDGPGAEFFQAIENALGSLPFVAEDLGDIDETVLELRDAFHLPGMKVLQFAFGEDMAQSHYIPHNFSNNFIVYTGTHDNNTTRGWFTTEGNDAMKARVEAYVGRALSAAEIHLELGRMAYASVADIVILPLQDILGLDETTRMNTPASGENNWGWRLSSEDLLNPHEDRLRSWTRLYNRE